MKNYVKPYELLEESIKKETDPWILRYIYIENKGKIANITLQRLISLDVLDLFELYQIATEDDDSENRRMAIKIIPDQQKLFSIAISDRDKENCIIAVGKITDQDLLFSISKNKALDNEIRVAAVERIDNEKYLIDIIENGLDKRYNLGVNQLRDKDDPNRKASFQTIAEFLLRKKVAVSQLKNQEYLRDFVKRPYEFFEIKVIALQNITEELILKDLKETIKEPELLVIIRNQLGTNKDCK